MEKKVENKNYYVLLFMQPKHPLEEFKTDLEILKASFDVLSKEYSALVGFEEGKNRVLAVHILLKNINIDRFVVRKNYLVVDFEYLRLWYERKSALRIVQADELPKVEEYLKKLCPKNEIWGNRDEKGTS